MIKLLHIENVAVIEKADIEFTRGLNVLTGETGSGKSIVIDSLCAVTGKRTSRDLIRTGAEYASVTAVFSDIDKHLSEVLAENGIEPDSSGELFITRRVSNDGKSVCRVNNTPVSVATLKDIGEMLIDIHGQNDGRKLLDEGFHLSYLDIYGEITDKVKEYQDVYESLVDTTAMIKKLSMDDEEKARRIDTLRYQITEIEQAKLRVGEQEELTSRRQLLQNASKLQSSVDAAFTALFGGESSDTGAAISGVVELLTDAGMQLERASQYSQDIQSLGKELDALRFSAEDMSDKLRDFRQTLDFSPGDLEEIEGRLDVIGRINRKYGTEEQALQFAEKASAELLDIEDSSKKISELKERESKLIGQATLLAEGLTKSRKQIAGELQKLVELELTQLNMPGVRFAVEFDTVTEKHGLSHSGADNVCFLISANIGESLGKINKIASGGELSRIMLALKNVISSDKNDIATMVFDEIDSGVSGVAAQKVGEKLAKLAKLRQILCVTHLPQIAVMADTHFNISKSIDGGRTYTYVNELDFEGRTKETAHLVSGESITDKTLESAEQQLIAAAKVKESL